MSFAVSGVNCAAATPLNADLTPDLGHVASHCRQLIEDGCHGIALLGTTGEANSFSVGERKAILEAAIGAVGAERLLPGIGCAAGPDTIELARHALSNGVTRVVMLPPFYYKGVSDDGLYAAYARIIEAVNDPRLRVILYHIPQTSAVPLSLALIARLRAAFPDTVIGIKDSSGDFENMKAIVAANPGFSVLAGADTLMLPLLNQGGAGCITAASNLAANSLRFIYDNRTVAGRAGAVETAQARVTAYRTLANTYVQLSTIKAMLSLKTSDAGWTRVRPPLMPLNDTQYADIKQKFAALP